eukprot:g1176.t1
MKAFPSAVFLFLGVVLSTRTEASSSERVDRKRYRRHLRIASEPEGGAEEKAVLNDETRYWGEPSIGSDGTEGNGAYYKYNMLPTSPAVPVNHQEYWRKSPYWNYFKSVWGDAPMADANFELWIRGFFKDFSLPRHPQDHQTTRGLPAWLHYYNSKYDPMVDPPYLSDYALFATKEGVDAPEVKRPEGLVDGGWNKESPVHVDCSEYNGHGDQIIDRPCSVRTEQRYVVHPYAPGGREGRYGLDQKKWNDKRNMAGPINGEPEDQDDLKDTYIKTDRWWANSKGDGLLPNMPPPPDEPPALEGGETPTE